MQSVKDMKEKPHFIYCRSSVDSFLISVDVSWFSKTKSLGLWRDPKVAVRTRCTCLLIVISQLTVHSYLPGFTAVRDYITQGYSLVPRWSVERWFPNLRTSLFFSRGWSGYMMKVIGRCSWKMARDGGTDTASARGRQGGSALCPTKDNRGFPQH